jgi:hypothetical protein
VAELSLSRQSFLLSRFRCGASTTRSLSENKEFVMFCNAHETVHRFFLSTFNRSVIFTAYHPL